MADAFKVCPICETANHRNATMCVTCGTTLTEVPATHNNGSPSAQATDYDYRYGETDLQEDALSRKGQAYLFAILGVLSALMLVGLGMMLAPLINTITATPTPLGLDESSDVSEGMVIQGDGGINLFVTNTPRPTVILATVTEGPPTPTITPSPTETPTEAPTSTPEPCIQTVEAGQGLYTYIARCGHRSLDVVPLVVQENNLNNENDIKAGQVLRIPWPTETPDPNPPPPPVEESPPEGESMGDSISVAMSLVDNPPARSSEGGLTMEEIRATQAVDPFFVPTPTNIPGIGQHIVNAGENISTIIVQYGTSIEVLNQLNPEITFSQCDFGRQFGGERCIVLLRQGQAVRVPVPTPTPTATFTPSGSETPTPTATPTINAPSALSPSNRAYLRRDELVTLRWVVPGALTEGETYRLQIQNITSGERFTHDTTELFFVIPATWQGNQNQPHEYTWTVSIVNPNAPNRLLNTTEPLSFTWEGRER